MVMLHGGCVCQCDILLLVLVVVLLHGGVCLSVCQDGYQCGIAGRGTPIMLWPIIGAKQSADY